MIICDTSYDALVVTCFNKSRKGDTLQALFLQVLPEYLTSFRAYALNGLSLIPLECSYFISLSFFWIFTRLIQCLLLACIIVGTWSIWSGVFEWIFKSNEWSTQRLGSFLMRKIVDLVFTKIISGIWTNTCTVGMILWSCHPLWCLFELV